MEKRGQERKAGTERKEEEDLERRGQKLRAKVEEMEGDKEVERGEYQDKIIGFVRW